MSMKGDDKMGDMAKLAAILLACAAVANGIADDDDSDDDC